MSAILLLLLWTAESGSDASVTAKTERGTIGESIEYERYSEYYRPGHTLLDTDRVPFAWAFQHTFKEVRQGQAVYRWRERPLWLVHNFSGTRPTAGAEMPLDYQARVFIIQTAASGGRASPSAVTSEVDVQGNFEAVEPHPTLPLFAAIRYGCCDDLSLVSVYDLSGTALCPEASYYLGNDTGHDIWKKLPIEEGKLTCPDERRVPVPDW
jgi:hypothetical protein